MNQKKKWLKPVLVLAALLIAAGVIYLTSFHNADVLRIENGKAVGAKPTWLIGHFAEKGKEARYYKLADVNTIKDYTTDKTATDPDGDSITTFFAWRGKNQEKQPGTVLIQPYSGTLEEWAAAQKSSLCGVQVVEGQEGQMSRSEGTDPKELAMAIPSPYPEACIEVRVTLPADHDDQELLALLAAAVSKVTPGKQLSPLVADFKLNFLDDSRWTYLWNGLLVTLEITLGAVLLGIVIGVIVATVRSTWDQNGENMRPGIGKALLSGFNSLFKLYLTVIRGTPVVIQLMIMYYIIFSSSRNGVLIAMLAFGINSGAYVAEIIRGGIMSVDRGQLEAGRSLGFNYVQTMQHIIIPQAMKNVLPALANEFIVLLKETSVSGYVAVKDLTKGGDIILGVTYSAFMPLLAVAAIYLVMVMFFTWLVGKLERRLRSSDH